MFNTAHKLSQYLNRHSIRAIASCGGHLGRIREGRQIKGDIDFDFLVRNVTKEELTKEGYQVETRDILGNQYLCVIVDDNQWIDLYESKALQAYTRDCAANLDELWDSYFVAPFMGHSFLWSNLEIKLIQSDYYGTKDVDHFVDHFEQTLHLQPVRLQAKRVIFDGVFDPLHRGHIDFIRRIKETFGESECLLTVAVLSDNFVQTYKPKPMMTEDDRHAVVSALLDVDQCVIINSPGDLKGYDHYVTSEEYQHSDLLPWVRTLNPTFLPRSPYGSSTQIKECLQQS